MKTIAQLLQRLLLRLDLGRALAPVNRKEERMRTFGIRGSYWMTILSIIWIAGTAVSAEADVYDPAKCPSGMISYWRAEGNGSDSYGSNNGSMSGGATFAAGQVGQAFSLDGDGDYISLPNSSSLKPDPDFTVCAWIRTTGTGSRAIMTNYEKPNPGPEGELGFHFHLENQGAGLHTANLQINQHCGCSCDTTAMTTVNDDHWHHVAAVHYGSTVEYYIDGVHQSCISGLYNNVGYYSTMHPAIGARWQSVSGGFLSFFPGLIDEVAIFDRVLTGTEIEQMYENTLAGYSYCADPPAEIHESIQARSGSGSCPDCAPALAPSYPRFTTGDPDLYEDYFTLENSSASGIEMPIRTVLSTLTPAGVYGANPDGGDGSAPTAYWEYSLASHDGTTSADGTLDPGERIARIWQIADEGGATFEFWADVYAPGAKGDFWLGGIEEKVGTDLASDDPILQGDAFVLDDGTAEIHAGSAGGDIVLANRFSTSSPVSLQAVSFYASGWAAGDEAEVILYEDPTGEAGGPAPSMEVWRTTVVLGGGGFQEVPAQGCPVLNAGGAIGAAFFAAVANRAERSYTLGIDQTGPHCGISYVSTDGGASFAPLSTMPVMDGNAMIRAEGETVGTCFIGDVLEPSL